MKKVIAALAATVAHRGETQTLEQASRSGASTAATTTPKVDPLSTEEKAVLKKLEKVIESGLKVFLQVGEALQTIRIEKLYRDTHPTFETYCRERWGMSKTQANRLIAAFEVSKNLAPIGVAPTSESQVRVLSGIPAPDQLKVMKHAIKSAGGFDKVTAKTVAESADKLGIKTAPQSQGTSAGAATGTRQTNDKLVNRDAVVAAITEWAEDNWEKVSQLSVADFVTSIKGVIAKI